MPGTSRSLSRCTLNVAAQVCPQCPQPSLCGVAFVCRLPLAHLCSLVSLCLALAIKKLIKKESRLESEPWYVAALFVSRVVASRCLAGLCLSLSLQGLLIKPERWRLIQLQWSCVGAMASLLSKGLC